ncbi:MAG: chitobiase/beta-hexosaminidase C-terminal domain-containing protein, partial [Paramuribaculum sp.]|nr:chitobiase/beta-hexosaminidase C-terminal domain-containing protein [Paramuribaculum sp.]
MNMLNHYEANGYNYAKHMFDVAGTITPDLDNGTIILTLQTIDDAPIHFTLDGSEPTEESPVYTEPVVISESADIKAIAFRPQGNDSKTYKNSVSFNKATARPVTLVNDPHPSYAAQKGVTLVDGKFGTTSFNNGDWVGFAGKDLIADINLESEQEISSVALRTNVDTQSWIFDAREIEVAVSADGKNFKTVASQT